MSKQRRVRYQILGRGSGFERIQLVLDNEEEAAATARELAGLPRQSPVAVIDTGTARAVKFYFADGSEYTVLRKPLNNRLSD